MTRIITILSILVLATGCVAEQKDVPTHGDGKIGQLIKDLGAEDIETREKAQGELIKIGEGLIQQYLKEKRQEENPEASNLELITSNVKTFADGLQNACKSSDLEVKMRASKILQTLCSRYQPKTKVAFASHAGGNSNIYVMDLEDKTAQRLTKGEAACGKPVWSPDGKRIAFMTDSAHTICAMDADGGNLTLLPLIKGPKEPEGWSPDGKCLLFTSITASVLAEGNIYIADADGNNVRQLTTDGGSGPVYSPDGGKIAFISTKRSSESDRFSSGIYVMEAGGENLTKLAELTKFNREGDFRKIAWSPDGKKLALATNYNIYTIDADGAPDVVGGLPIVPRSEAERGKNLKKISRHSYSTCPAWSPDGQKIVFICDEGKGVSVMDADGSNERKLTQANALYGECSWSPDGTKILYTFNEYLNKNSPNPKICVMDADGGNKRELTDGTAFAAQPKWFPVRFPELTEILALLKMP